jgi:hypothetical protein
MEVGAPDNRIDEASKASVLMPQLDERRQDGDLPDWRRHLIWIS